MYYQRYGSKYGAKRTEYNGIIYDSKFEASVAQELDMRKAAGEIADWERQYKVEMWAYNKAGDPVIKKTHKVDFRVHLKDGSYELLEAKGVETADWRDRRRWLEKLWLPEHLDHTYTVVKQRR
jgi:hypothetical protein